MEVQQNGGFVDLSLFPLTAVRLSPDDARWLLEDEAA